MTTVLKFSHSPGSFTGVGFNANSPNAIPPIGANVVLTTRLSNIGSQFGTPSGAVVGRALLDCTVPDVSGPNIDGICNGIAHVPDGYFTFGGNGAFSNAAVNYYDITGGDGPYANDWGEVKVVNKANGGSIATVTLSAP